MAAFKPSFPYNVPMVLLAPTITTVSGVEKKSFPTVEQALVEDTNFFYASFKTYGGTERDVNGVYSVEDTANIETWFRPDIVSNCRIARATDGAIYDIINEPEDIEQRHQFMKFKIKRIKGGV